MRATYSPEDNKLRLYPDARLDPEDYAKVRAAGFIWAPKQELFVAPMWTPDRADLLTDWCGEIEDEDTTLVDRAADRAERFEDYSDNRQDDADRAHAAVHAIADNIPLGQPILVGHHSERHARKDAKKIERGMRKAVQMWETAKYWERRAAGARRHAEYVLRPDVRHRRIKGLEADQRRHAKSKAEAEKALAIWTNPKLTQDLAVRFAGSTMSGHLQLPRKEGDDPTFSGRQTAYGALTDSHVPRLYAPRTLAEVIDAARQHYPAMIADCDRWLQHIENRIAYERAMLGEDGGTAADKFPLSVGGRVLYRGSWCVILKINKAGGRINSLTCTPPAGATWAKTWKIEAENVQDYKEPAEGDAEKVAKATKLPPLCNYPGEGFRHMTEEEYKRTVPKWSDFPKIATLQATEKHGRHRVKQTRAKGGAYYETELVYLTDAKRTDPPAPEPPAGGLSFESQREPRAVRVIEQQPQDDANAEKFEKLKDTLRAGVKVVSAPQLFPTPPDLARRMCDEAGILAGRRVLEPSAGTGNILRAILNNATGADCVRVVAVELNHALVAQLEGQRQKTIYANSENFRVICADFMECNGDLGKFDAVIMNPPFANAQDVQHIKHAMQFLKPGGRLVAICANGPRQQEQLKPLMDSWEPLPADTFKESGTGVNTALLIYDAPPAVQEIEATEPARTTDAPQQTTLFG